MQTVKLLIVFFCQAENLTFTSRLAPTISTEVVALETVQQAAAFRSRLELLNLPGGCDYRIAEMSRGRPNND